MRRETAYKLAGRRHGEHHGTAVSGLQKEREIRFRPLPPNQVEQACSALRALRGLVARPSEKADTICVEYSILDYSLESLEKALTDAGCAAQYWSEESGRWEKKAENASSA